MGEQVGDNCSFVFQDRKEVCFITNVFPEKMDSKVVRPQPGVLRAQSVPPLLPAYNKILGGVDRTDQFRKSYGFDRKPRRSWIRLFFQFLDSIMLICCTSIAVKDIGPSLKTCYSFIWSWFTYC